MPYRTDDPIADFARWDAEQAAQEGKLPRCDYCNEPVQDDYFYQINDEVICPDCLNNHFRKEVDV